MHQNLKFWLRHRAQAAWLVVVLSLATAVATAAWSISYGVWLQPTPFREPDRLVSVGWIDSRDSERWSHTSIPEYVDWQGATRGLLTLASAESMSGWYLQTADSVVDIHAVSATTNYFNVLDVSAQAGRLFQPNDARSPAGDIGVISDRLWHTTFGGNPGVIGRTLHTVSVLEDHTVTIVGVLPPRVRLPFLKDTADLIVATEDGVRAGQVTSRRAYLRTVIGRLADHVTREQAEAHLTPILRQIDHDNPLFSRTRTASLMPLHEYLYGRSRQFLLLLGAAALLVVIVTAANAAGVMLAMMSRRTRELAVRVAIGASPGRLLQQTLGEVAVIAAVAAVLSVMIAQGFVDAFVTWAPRDVPRLDDVTVDWRAGGIALAVSLGFSLLLGVLPATLRRHADVVGALHSGGGTSTTSTRTLLGRRIAIGLQVALVLALLAASGLVGSTLRGLLNQPLGFNPDRIVVAEVRPTRAYFKDPAQYQQVMDRMQAAVATAPGSRDVALAFDPPLGMGISVRVDFLDRPARGVAEKMVSGGFFHVMGIPLLAGRDFTRADYATGQFVIVNELFAKNFLGGVQAAVGREIVLGPFRHQVVGVVGNVREAGLSQPLAPVFYPVLSTALLTPGMFHVVSREAARASMPGVIEQAVHHADPTSYVHAYALTDRLLAQTAVARTQTAVLGLLAAFTLLLAALGIYATIAQIVEERQRDFGIRSALGASSRSLVLLATRAVLAPVIAGALGGAALAWVIAQVVRQFLFNMSPFDPFVWTAAMCALIGVAACAAWLPARRAGTVDPVVALRQS